MEIGQREIELRGGRIVLYTRADDRHGIWQCRLRLGAGPPPLSWSTVIVRKRRTRDGEQTTQTGRDRHEVTAG